MAEVLFAAGWALLGVAAICLFWVLLSDDPDEADDYEDAEGA